MALLEAVFLVAVVSVGIHLIGKLFSAYYSSGRDRFRYYDQIALREKQIEAENRERAMEQMKLEEKIHSWQSDMDQRARVKAIRARLKDVEDYDRNN